MAYFRTGYGEGSLAGLGCGPACHCEPCRSLGQPLGERYEPDEEDEEPDPAPPAGGRAAAPPRGNGAPRPAASQPLAGWGQSVPWQLGGFAELPGTVVARHPRTGISCEARERRIRPVMEPPASELVAVDPRHLVFPSRVLLHRQTYDAYRRLKTAAEGDGIPATILRIVSGYRSVEQQRRLWTDALRRYGSAEAARRWVMPPGASPRHSGRAIDFWLGRPNSSANIPALRGTPAYAWLVCNAIQFGFFPHAREPWLWEFNPTAPGPPTRT